MRNKREINITLLYSLIFFSGNKAKSFLYTALGLIFSEIWEMEMLLPVTYHCSYYDKNFNCLL